MKYKVVVKLACLISKPLHSVIISRLYTEQYEGRNYLGGGGGGAELVMYVLSVHGSYDNSMLLYTGECALLDHTLYAIITVEPLKSLYCVPNVPLQSY